MSEQRKGVKSGPHKYKPTVCVYHGGCDDGFSAAWAVWKKWASLVEYIPMRYGDNLPDLTGEKVLMVDFSLKRDHLLSIKNDVKSIVIIDHHKTAEKELAEFVQFKGYDNVLTALQRDNIVSWFDMKKAGCTLAWDFCFPEFRRPVFLNYVEDRDLWRFKYKQTKQFSAALRSHKQSFQFFNKLLDEDFLEHLIADGEAILRAHDKNINTFLNERVKLRIGDNVVPAVNVPYHYASDCAHELLNQSPKAAFAVAFFIRNDNTVQFSLRSEDKRVDVSNIAKQYNGGGHRNASGFQLPLSDFMSMVIGCE